MGLLRHAGLTALALLATAYVGPSRAEQILVASLVDDIVYADLVADGDCYDGCTREEHAIAHVSGTPSTESCELQTITPFDSADVEPGLLRASIYCEDATGALIEQGTAPCKFEICVDFAWTDGEGDNEGQLTYDVVIVRDSKPRAPHTIYVDLSVAIDPTASNTNVDSCQKNGTCAAKVCTEPEAYTALVSRGRMQRITCQSVQPAFQPATRAALVRARAVRGRRLFKSLLSLFCLLLLVQIVPLIQAQKTGVHTYISRSKSPTI